MCHATIDPIAGGFRGFSDFDYKHFDPSAPWHDDMLPPGFAGKDTPPEDKGQSLNWLAQQMVKDQRFPRAIVLAMLQAHTGSAPPRFPEDSKAKTYEADIAGFRAYDAMVQKMTVDFQLALPVRQIEDRERHDGRLRHVLEQIVDARGADLREHRRAVICGQWVISHYALHLLHLSWPANAVHPGDTGSVPKHFRRLPGPKACRFQLGGPHIILSDAAGGVEGRGP